MIKPFTIRFENITIHGTNELDQEEVERVLINELEHFISMKIMTARSGKQFFVERFTISTQTSGLLARIKRLFR